MTQRYIRNMNTLTAAENDSLKHFRVCVVGCGGLGGYVIELLGRLGIGYITAVDGDVFDESNLNRQLLSDEHVLGMSKAETAKVRMATVNSHVAVNAHFGFLTEENASDILGGHDLVIDALDSIPARLIAERHCASLGIPLVHGAIGGWYGQVCVVMPGDHTLSRLYPEGEDKGAEAELGNPSFTPALVASLEVSEAIKVLLGKGDTLAGKLLTIDLLHHEYDIFEL